MVTFSLQVITFSLQVITFARQMVTFQHKGSNISLISVFTSPDAAERRGANPHERGQMFVLHPMRPLGETFQQPFVKFLIGMDSERPQNLRDPGEVKLGNTMLEGEGFRKKLVQFVKVVAVQPNDRRFFQHFHRFHRRATVRHIVNGRNEIALRHEPDTCFLSKSVLINPRTRPE